MSSKSIYKPEIPDLSQNAQCYSTDVLQIARGEMRKTGNYVNADHEEGMRTVTDSAALLYVDSPGLRISVDLFTGGGKTTIVSSLLQYLISFYDIPTHHERGVLVCVGTQDQADELLNSVMGSPFVRRINERRRCIGTYHQGETATIKNKSEVGQYPFIIVTHERIKIQDWQGFINHRDQQRLVIWDEAMVATESKVIKIFDLMEEIRTLQLHLDANAFFFNEEVRKEHDELLQWLQEIEAVFKEVQQDCTIPLPDKPDWVANRKRKLFKNEFEQKFFGFESEIVLTLLNEVSRRVKVNTKSHAFWYVEQIPETFGDILILDASTPIRKLVHYDDSIIRVDSGVKKDYSDVVLQFCRARSSRYALEDNGNGERFLKEIQHIVENEVPTEYKLVTFALKQKWSGPDHLEEVGKTGERVVPWSWGKSKGINSFSGECYGTHFGTVYRERKELAANAAGQKRDINFTLTDAELDELIISEIADQVFQAISRLQNRKTINLKALPTTFWLFFPDERIIDMLRVVMPGVQVREYVPKYVETEGAVAVTAVDQMVEWVKGCGLSKVSMREIRKSCGITMKATDRLWIGQVKPRFEAELERIGWGRSGQSYQLGAC